MFKKFLNNVVNLSEKFERNINSLGSFNIFFQLFIIIINYFNNERDLNFIIPIVSIGISLTWIISGSFSKNISRLIYLYTTFIFNLLFVSAYAASHPCFSLYVINNFLLLITWMFIFCDLIIAISINVLILSITFIFYFGKTHYNFNEICIWNFVIALFTIYYKCLKNQENEHKIYKEDLDKIIESKTNFINNIIHEIRSPLHGLLTITGILNDKPSLSDEEYNKQINIVYTTIEHLSKMTNDFLDYAKINAGKMIFNFEKIDLIKIIEKIIHRCEELYLNLSKKNLKIVFMHNNLPEALILGDELKISQLLNNLLLNAIKYSVKGNIIIKINDYHEDNSKLYWEIVVIDDGIGINESELKTIFDPFVRSATAEYTNLGTGLGLTFSKEIVLEHKGKIWAENNKNKAGAMFTIILPKFKLKE